MWSKSSCCLNTNRKAVANLVNGFRFGTAAINHHNGSTSKYLRHRKKSPHSTKSLLMQGRSYRVSILGRPSPYSMNHLLLGRPSPYSMDHPMAPARYNVEEYDKKKNAKLHLMRVVEARQMLCDGDFIQNLEIPSLTLDTSERTVLKIGGSR